MAETKSILITGCSTGGIGDAVALAFHRRGHKVIATARDLSKVKHLEELGISIVRLDVLDEVSIQEAAMVVSGVVDGKLDILVNNAGVGKNLPYNYSI
jgi:1-acylglycerone phosphate reductase